MGAWYRNVASISLIALVAVLGHTLPSTSQASANGNGPELARSETFACLYAANAPARARETASGAWSGTRYLASHQSE